MTSHPNPQSALGAINYKSTRVRNPEILMLTSSVNQPRRTIGVVGQNSQRNLAWTCVFAMIAMFALTVGSANAQTAPANAVIGNQASAQYVDTANPLITLTSSSNTVQTTVAQVYSLTLTANGAQTKPANQQVCYPHTLTNTGNGVDTFALSPVALAGGFSHVAPLAYYADSNGDGVPDNGTAITSSGALAAGAQFRFVMCGNTPPSATVGQTGTMSVTATSSAPTSPPTASNTDTTTIGNCSITLTKQFSTTPPPGVTPISGGPSPNNAGLYVVLNYNNSGSVACNNVVIQDTLQSGFLYRAGSGRWSNSGTNTLTDTNDGAEVANGNIDYRAPANGASGLVYAAIGSVNSSTAGNLFFRVDIAGSLPVGITAASSNQATVSYVDSVSMVATNNAPSNTATYNVQQVANVSFNGAAATTGTTDAEPVTVASASPGQTIQWTAYVWNRGNAADTFDIRFLDGTGTPVGNSATFTGGNCSASNVAANSCTFPAGTTFSIFRADGITSLIDTNGNTTPDSTQIPLPVVGPPVCPAQYVSNAPTNTACGYPVVIRATIPMGAAATMTQMRVVLEARSAFDGAVVDTVPLVLNAIGANTVDLTNTSPFNSTTPAPGQGAGTATVITNNNVTPSVSSSVTTRFPIYVNNTSAVPAIYNLSGQYISVPGGASGLSNPPVNWTLQFRLDGGAGNCSTVSGGTITSTGASPIAAGGNLLVCGEVVVPPTNGSGAGRPTDSPPGVYVLEFRAELQGNPAVFDTKRDSVTIGNANNVTITPNGTQQTSPGGSVTYSHTITNSGNVTETISFPATPLSDSQVPTYAWTSAAYLDNLVGGTQGVLDIGTDVQITNATTFTMAPNTTRTIFIRVNAPAMAGSPPNVTTLTAQYNAGGSSASVTDTTTLTSGLRLDKYQQTTSCASAPSVTLNGLGVPNAPWSSGNIAASAATAPGQCIAYLVVGTNTTANPINNIVISDVVPANTRYETTCTPATATTGPLFLTPTPANGFTGTVQAVSATAPTGPAAPAAQLLSGGRVTLQFCVRINP
jgi:trimeric autotransporter adhesin